MFWLHIKEIQCGEDLKLSDHHKLSMSLQLLFCLKNNLKNSTGINFGYINKPQCPGDWEL